MSFLALIHKYAVKCARSAVTIFVLLSTGYNSDPMAHASPVNYNTITESQTNVIYKQEFSLTLGHMIHQLMPLGISIPDSYREFPRTFVDIISPVTGREITSLDHLNPFFYLQRWHSIGRYLPPSVEKWPIKVRLLAKPIPVITPEGGVRHVAELPGGRQVLLYLLLMLGLACVISRRFLVFVRYVLWSLASPVLGLFGFFARLFQKR